MNLKNKHDLMSKNLKGKNISCREIIFPVNQYCYLIQEKFGAKKASMLKRKAFLTRKHWKLKKKIQKVSI